MREALGGGECKEVGKCECNEVRDTLGGGECKAVGIDACIAVRDSLVGGGVTREATVTAITFYVLQYQGYGRR